MNLTAFSTGMMLALQTIRAHKLRAFLTVVGVIIGTGTIIGVGAIMTGFDTSMTAVLRSFGPNSIIVFKFPVGFRVGNLSPEERTRKNLTFENARHIQERCRAVAEVSPMLFINNTSINVHYQGNDMYDVNLFGVDEAYADGGQVDLHHCLLRLQCDPRMVKALERCEWDQHNHLWPGHPSPMDCTH